jgi:hypothetical protein
MTEPGRADLTRKPIQEAAYVLQKAVVKRQRNMADPKSIHPKWWRSGFLRKSLGSAGFGSRSVSAFLASVRECAMARWKYGGGYRTIPGSTRDSAYWHVEFEDDLLKVRPRSLLEYEAHVQARARLLSADSGADIPDGRSEERKRELAERIESVIRARLANDASGGMGEPSLRPLYVFHILVRELVESIVRKDPVFDGLPEDLVFHVYHGGDEEERMVSDEEITGWLWRIVDWLRGSEWRRDLRPR